MKRMYGKATFKTGLKYTGSRAESTRTGRKILPQVFNKGFVVLTAEYLAILEPNVRDSLRRAGVCFDEANMVIHTVKNHYRLSKQKQAYERDLKHEHLKQDGAKPSAHDPLLQDVEPRITLSPEDRVPLVDPPPATVQLTWEA